MPLFQSKTKIIIPFDTIYLLRIEKIGIPLFLLKWHYNPFFLKTKISPFIVIAFFLFSPRSTGIVPFPSHVIQSHSHLFFTRVQSQVRAGLFSGAILSISAMKASQVEVKTRIKQGKFRLSWENSKCVTIRRSSRISSFWLFFRGNKYTSRHLTKVRHQLMRNR